MASKTGSLSPGHPKICDYEGSAYQSEFWTRDRAYEDRVERIALRALLPPSGRRLIEVGAGFGRLVDLYQGYDQVVLFDYSRSMLREARRRLGEAGPGGRPRYLYVAGDFYAFPFAPAVFDAVTMVRVIHHAQDAPRVLRGIYQLLAPHGTFVLEFANKRHLKAIARWLLRRQAWSPFALPPVEFVELNFDFHPRWMQTRLQEAGLVVQTMRTVSHFRLQPLKRAIPTPLLAWLDGLVQPTGRWWQLSPSVFVQCSPSPKPAAVGDDLFRCPRCQSFPLVAETTALFCQVCRSRWTIRDGLYDLKVPVPFSPGSENATPARQ